MATQNENVIEEALLAMMGACVDLNYRLEELAREGQALAQDNSSFLDQLSLNEMVNASSSTLRRAPSI